MKKILLAGLMMLAPLGAEVTVIRNATIMTEGSKGTFKGSILVRDGKIAEVGENVMVPQGATVIDAAGQWVIPGIIDCHSHIAADGSINEMSVSVSSMVNIKDVLNPEDIAIYHALAGGVTSANILHGSANSIGGQTIVIKTRWGKSAQELIFEGATPGIKFALGENPKRSNQQGGRGQGSPPARYPATRMGVEDTIREAFNEAKQYKGEWDSRSRRSSMCSKGTKWRTRLRRTARARRRSATGSGTRWKPSTRFPITPR
jgi:imidazolonepropionase-like amidohydrolase